MAHKLTKEEFIDKARAVHDSYYDYSKIDYKNNKTKVIITCKKHGDFLQTPNQHLSGKGCPECASNFKLTTRKFIDRSRVIHGNLYDYTKVDYKNSKTKVVISCKEHGDFEQRPFGHLAGKGCSVCSGVVKHTFETLSEVISKRHEGTITLVENQIISGTSSKYKFRHVCGYEWVAKASNVAHSTSCPKCCTTGFNPDKAAVFYILDIDGDSKFTGFGISNRYKERKSVHKRNLKDGNCFIMSEILISTHGSVIQELEKYIKQTLQCNNSDIEGFKTESVLMTPEALLDICREWLIANGKEFTIK